MVVHMAVFLILLGASYVAVAFFGAPGDMMVFVPAVFVIYLGLAVLAPKLRRKAQTRE